MRDILKYAQSLPDFNCQAMCVAFQEMNALVLWIEEQKCIAENNAKIVFIEEHLRGGRTMPQIVQPGRTFIREGTAVEDKIEKKLFLFSDSTLVVTNLEERYILFDKLIYLSHCEVNDDDKENGICMKIGHCAIYHFKFENVQEKKKWITDLERIINTLGYARDTSVTPHVSTSTIEYQGYLDLKSSEDDWFRHWTVLEDGILYLFSDVSSRKTMSAINLSEYFITTVNKLNTKTRWVMQMYNSESDGFIFGAPTKDVRKEWMKKIKNFCLFSEEKLLHTPQRQNSMNRLTRSRSVNKSQNPIFQKTTMLWHLIGLSPQNSENSCLLKNCNL